MAKILVTGATGFVGRQLVPALVAAGHDVRCAVRRKVDWLISEQVLVSGLEQYIDWSLALQDIELVIHLAARVHVMREQSTSPLEDYCKVNSVATENLAQQAAQFNIKRFIFLSSIKVNGEVTAAGVPFTEDSIPKPEDAYGQSKLFAEQNLQKVCKNSGMEFVIIRPPLVYGPGVKANFLKMLQLAQKGWPLPFGKVQNRRSFVYIDNLVSALCAVAVEPKAANQVYLVADNNSLSLPQLLQLIADAMNKRARLLPIPVTFMVTLFKLLGLNGLNARLFASLEVNTDKINAQIGWKAPIASAEGLKKTAQWYQCDCVS